MNGGIGMAGEVPEKSGTRQSGGLDTKIVLLAAAALTLLVLGIVFMGPASPPAAQNGGSGTAALETPTAKLLLDSFDRGASASSGKYFLNYTVNDNGATAGYEIASNGTHKWIRESGDFGSRSGYYGPNKQGDAVCLTYNGETRCARAGADETVSGIAENLRLFIPTMPAYSEQKKQVHDLIAAGAINFVGAAEVEKVGNFETRRISYTLDYRNLTVQQLISIGVPPNDDSIYRLTERRITYWIEDETGLIVKSVATYKEAGVQKAYEIEYSQARVGDDGGMVAAPTPVVSADSFAKFYSESAANYRERLACFGMASSEQEICLKSLASRTNDWETCKLIGSKEGYERCTVIVAQNTHNYILCEKLDIYPDDCFISVAGENGNFELCKKLKDASLVKNCTAAAAAGAKKAEAEMESARHFYETTGCSVASDCRTAGNANQYCVPKNNTRPFS